MNTILTNMIKNAFILLLMATAVLNTSCVKEHFSAIDDDDVSPEQESTYANLFVHIDSKAGTGTEDAERKVDNLSLLFFGSNNRLEVNMFFTSDKLILNVQSGSYSLKEVVMVTAGQKKVVALVNTPETLRGKLQNLKTYSDYMDLKVATAGDLTDGPMNTYLQDMGITGRTSSGQTFTTDFNALLMTGEKEVTLEAGATQTEVEAGMKNVIEDLRVDRTMAKVTIKVNGLLNPANSSPGFKLRTSEKQPLVTFGNLPKFSYLLKHTNNRSPFFSSVDFSEWKRNLTTNTQETRENAFPTNGAVDFTFYVPENTFATPYRGNTTFMGIIAKMSYKDSNNYWCIYDEDNNQTSYLPAGTSWNANKHEHIRTYFNTVSTYIKNQAKGTLSPDSIVVMKDYLRNKKSQDSTLAIQLGTPQPSGWVLFVYPTKELDQKFETERWYDEMQLYYYTGQVDGNGPVRIDRHDFKAAYYKGVNYYRLNLEDFKADALSAKRYAVNRNDWFAITVKSVRPIDGNGFKFPGYPDIQDLTRSASGSLYESFLDVDIKVKDWDVEGSNDVPLE